MVKGLVLNPKIPRVEAEPPKPHRSCKAVMTAQVSLAEIDKLVVEAVPALFDGS